MTYYIVQRIHTLKYNEQVYFEHRKRVHTFLEPDILLNQKNDEKDIF